MPDLFSADISGDTGLVASLLSEDPKLVHAVNERKRTALHYAAREGHADVVRTLLQSGADPYCVIYPNKEITLPRTLAWARGHDQVVAGCSRSHTGRFLKRHLQESGRHHSGRTATPASGPRGKEKSDRG